MLLEIVYAVVYSEQVGISQPKYMFLKDPNILNLE